MARKTVALPGGHDVDIEPIRPIIDTPVFQMLRYRRQLENANIVFVDANHTRFGHSLGTGKLARERGLVWEADQAITKKDVLDLFLFGVLHDIGHGPYSHATESLTGGSHHDTGMQRVKQISQEIKKCGSSAERILAMFTGQNPLAVAITHRPLGVDKVDYLLRDARNTTEAVRIRVGDLINHIYFRDGHLAIDRKIMPEVMQVQSDYVYMHDRVYLRRSAMIAKRFLQKIIALAMQTDEHLTSDWLWSWDTDDLALEAALLHSPSLQVREMFQQLRHRRLPKMAIALLPKGTTSVDRKDGKPIYVKMTDSTFLPKFDWLQLPAEASKVETLVAERIGLLPRDVLIIPTVTPERFRLDPVPVYDGTNYIGTLEEHYPSHYQHLAEVTRGYAAVRVCVPAEHRDRVANSKVAEGVIELLTNIIEQRQV